MCQFVLISLMLVPSEKSCMLEVNWIKIGWKANTAIDWAGRGWAGITAGGCRETVQLLDLVNSLIQPPAKLFKRKYKRFCLFGNLKIRKLCSLLSICLSNLHTLQFLLVGSDRIVSEIFKSESKSQTYFP